MGLLERVFEPVSYSPQLSRPAVSHSPSFNQVLQAYRVSCQSTVPSYSVSLVDDLFGSNSSFLASFLSGCRSLVVVTPTVDRIYGGRLRQALTAWQLDAHVLSIPCDEASKSMSSALQICEAAGERQIGRNDVLVAFGGGVCSDLVTLAASLIRRGIGHVRIPTTLIGQVDAGIGIKGGVNFGEKKNYLGCFHPPKEVLIDPIFLQTLGRAELSAGLSEIVKIALGCDRELFLDLLRHGTKLLDSGLAEPRDHAKQVIWRACQLMLNELAPNIYEDQTYERKVDFGHTFSPKLEALSNYRIRHGHAVAVDMAISSAIACEMGLLAQSNLQDIVSLLGDLELPTRSPLLNSETCLESLSEAARHRGGHPNLVIPVDLGEVDFIRRIEDIPPQLLGDALNNLDAVARALEKSPAASLAS